MLASLIIVVRDAAKAGTGAGCPIATQAVTGRSRWLRDRIEARSFQVPSTSDMHRPLKQEGAKHDSVALRPLRSEVAVGRAISGLAFAILTLTALSAIVQPAQADDPPTLVLRNHRFEPARIEVPAHVKFRLRVQNADDTADEFESTELNREKLVTPGQTITVFLGPLEPGEYKFFGDFHQDTARGMLVAK